MPIEQIATELERMVSQDQRIEELGTGYGGDQGPAEGPLCGRKGAIFSSATSTITGG